MTKHQLYLDLAKTISKYATCPKLQVGCVLVKDDRILSLGYNGAPRGVLHCTNVGCELVKVDDYESCKRSVHAEANAVINAAYVGASTNGAFLYSTHTPCYECGKLLINAGITSIIASNFYQDEKLKKLWDCRADKLDGHRVLFMWPLQ